VIVTRRAPPVDPGQRLAGDIGAELPEGLADAALAAAVPAGDDGGDDAAGLDQQVGNERGAQTGARQRVVAIFRGVARADRRHSVRPGPSP
jgi:hypothetical protein